MKKLTAISFEGDLVKVVFILRKKGDIVIQNTCLIQEKDFDSFLDEQHSLPELHVVYPFRRFYSDVIAVPPVKEKYLQTVVSAEIKKRLPHLRDFSLFYTLLSDKPAEEKGLRDVFFYAVESDEVNEVIDRFSRKGKTVRAIYPDILPLSHLIHARENTNEKTILGLLTSQSEQTLFLVKNARLRFVRVTASASKEISDEDIDNINMTVSYCRQQLRLEPEKILLLNEASDQQAPPSRTVVPIECPHYFSEPGMPSDFIVPLAATMHADELQGNNLLPQKYKTLFAQRLVLTYALFAMLIISLIGLGYSAFNFAEMLWYRGKIDLIRKNIAGVDASINRYDRVSTDVQRTLPFINLINEARSVPDVRKALASLSILPMEGIDIQGIQINNKEGVSQIQLTGEVRCNSYGEKHSTFQKLVDRFQADAQVIVKTKTLDVKNGQFQIELESKKP